MKHFLLFAAFSLCVSAVNAQSCDAGGCSNFVSQYPTGTFTTTSSTFSTVSTGMNAGNWTLFNVTSGNTYEWTYCSDFSPALENWNAELTLYNYSTGQLLCYQNNCNRTNCPNAPYLRWLANFTGTVKLLTSVSGGSNCMSNSGSPFSALVWRQASCSTPVQVQTLIATTISSTQINLNWTASIGATNYDIFRSTSSCVGSLLSNVTSTINVPIPGLTPGTTYYFNVTAMF